MTQMVVACTACIMFPAIQKEGNLTHFREQHLLDDFWKFDLFHKNICPFFIARHCSYSDRTVCHTLDVNPSCVRTKTTKLTFVK